MELQKRHAEGKEIGEIDSDDESSGTSCNPFSLSLSLSVPSFSIFLFFNAKMRRTMMKMIVTTRRRGAAAEAS